MTKVIENSVNSRTTRNKESRHNKNATPLQYEPKASEILDKGLERNSENGTQSGQYEKGTENIGKKHWTRAWKQRELELRGECKVAMKERVGYIENVIEDSASQNLLFERITSKLEREHGLPRIKCGAT